MNLTPFPYHSDLRDKLKSQNKVWDWFSSVSVKEDQLKELKTNLLKNTYRLDKVENVNLYQKIDMIKEELGIKNVDVTIYQAQNSFENNAGVIFVSGEGHLVLSGQILKLLTDEEMFSVLAHELSHVRFFSTDNGELEVADRVISSIANDYRTKDVYLETARLFRLYMELYCDRGALALTKDLNIVLSGLIKLNTGLEKVSVESYLKQADEILLDKKVKAEQPTHPENYIRAKALKLWNDKDENFEDNIKKLVEGDAEIDSLDLFKQDKIKHLTFDLLSLILKPKWMRTIATQSLAKQYDSNFSIDEKKFVNDTFLELLDKSSDSVKEYLSYVILDFALVDPNLEEVPLGFGFQLSEDFNLKEEFKKVVKKELKIGDKKLIELYNRSTKDLSKIKEAKEEYIYEE